jgi:2',3'-cyclic-nucleotide 2'-phosphodiesterase / 3'-nucleotidase
LRLRILATTDVHAHLLPWDYYLDRPLDGHGLAPVATLIRVARAEVANCLYFDNGDLIEGSPLAEQAVMADGLGAAPTHPMIAALNGLGCDAATLGNHEFSFGTGFLQRALQGARYPVVCANILTQKGDTPADDTPFVRPWVMLQREFMDDAGQMQPLRVGVFGVTPPQVLDWDKAVLGGRLQARGMVEAAEHLIPLIRAAGADIVVALAHTGLGPPDNTASTENVGRQLAGLSGLDAAVLGHEHLTYPLQSQTSAGLGAPVVMPGAYGSHLGVIDLVLRRGPQGWTVAESAADCRAIAARGAYGEPVALVAEDAEMAVLAEASHQATRRWMARQVGQTAVPLHSYFAMAQPTAVQALITAAQAAHLAEMLVGTRWEGLPVLSAAAPFKTGGRGGPEHFTNVPAGALLLRNAADLYVHPNRFAAICITGAGLREWLERAVTAYALVRPGVQDQPLLDAQFPGTCLEMIAGLSYEIDLSAPARYDAPTGQLTGAGRRIHDLRFQGAPIVDDMPFALATNSHRLGVLQQIMGAGVCEVIVDGAGMLGSRDVLLRHLARSQSAPVPPPLEWSFRHMPGTSVTLDTAPAAVEHLAEVAALSPEPLGLTEDGFLRFRLHL